jgi:hypothetical protein
VDEEEDWDDDDDDGDGDGDLERGRVGCFALGDPAAFRLKARYARALAALPTQLGPSPWLLHARGGAQSWPGGGNGRGAAFSPASSASSGAPWRAVLTHEKGAVHRLFAVVAELYEGMWTAGLVDDEALQLVADANAQGHHHLTVTRVEVLKRWFTFNCSGQELLKPSTHPDFVVCLFRAAVEHLTNPAPELHHSSPLPRSLSFSLVATGGVAAVAC